MATQPQPTQTETVDPVSDPRHPFGLPPGSVRGVMSLIICGFFWMVLLWPGAEAKAVLGHFFLLALVLMAFASNPFDRYDGGTPFVPWVLRGLFVGVSVLVVLYVMFTDPARLTARMNPNPDEFYWWGPFLATTAAGFAAGLLLRVLMGRANPLFRTFRSWLSVVGVLMLSLEIALFVMFTASGSASQEEFFHYWQAVELAFVSAYFGTRA